MLVGIPDSVGIEIGEGVSRVVSSVVIIVDVGLGGIKLAVEVRIHIRFVEHGDRGISGERHVIDREAGLHLDAEAQTVWSGQIGQDDFVTFPVGVTFGRVGDGDERFGAGISLHKTNVLQDHAADRIRIGDAKAMEEVGLIVVEIWKFDGQLTERAVGPVISPVHGGIVGVQKLGDGPPIRSRLRASDTEIDAAENRFQTEPIGDRTGKVNFHQIIFAHGIAIPLGPGDVHSHQGAGGVDRADDLGDVGRGGAQGEVARRGGFHKAQLDGRGSGGGNVFVAEAELAVQGVLHSGILGDLTDLDPSPDGGSDVIYPVSVEVGKGFADIVHSVAVGIDEGIPARPVAVGGLGDGIVVAGVAVIDVGPDLSHGGIRANDHLVTRSTDRVPILAGIDQIGLRGLGIIVESLGKGLVERGLAVALEEGSGAEHMKAVLQSGGEGVVVVVQVERNVGGVEVGDAEGGQHFLFVGDGSRPAREPGRSPRPLVFIGTNLVGKFGAGSGFRNRGAGPPVVRSLIVAPEKFDRFGGATTDAAGALGVTSVRGVVDKKAVPGADGVALDPDDHIRGAFDKLGSTHSGRSGCATDRIIGVVVEP